MLCSILDPGQIPVVNSVTKSVVCLGSINILINNLNNFFFKRFPAHELISGASKIPTIIYYDPEGKVRAVGAEATKEGILQAAEDGQWFKAEWSVHLQFIGISIIYFSGSSYIFVPSSVKDARSSPTFRHFLPTKLLSKYLQISWHTC